MIVEMWWMRRGIGKIMSFVFPSCLTAPLTCSMTVRYARTAEPICRGKLTLRVRDRLAASPTCSLGM